MILLQHCEIVQLNTAQNEAVKTEVCSFVKTQGDGRLEFMLFNKAPGWLKGIMKRMFLTTPEAFMQSVTVLSLVY